MAKHFSKAEREIIDQRLKEAAIEIFTEKGVRTVSINDLCKRVGVSNRSFYSFYESKYDLLLTLAEAYEKDRFLKIIEFTETFVGKSSDYVGELFDRIYDNYADGPIMEIITRPREFEKFMQKVTAERWEKFHAFGKREYYNKLTNIGLERKLFRPIDSNVLSELVSLLAQIISRRGILVEGQYKIYVSHLRDLFVLKLARPNNTNWL